MESEYDAHFNKYVSLIEKLAQGDISVEFFRYLRKNYENDHK